MTQTRCTGANAIVYFALCIGLFIMITYSNANVIYGEDDESANENAKAWYAMLLRSKPQFGFERNSRSYGKPTFIRFGKRDFGAYNPTLFKNK